MNPATVPGLTLVRAVHLLPVATRGAIRRIPATIRGTIPGRTHVMIPERTQGTTRATTPARILVMTRGLALASGLAGPFRRRRLQRRHSLRRVGHHPEGGCLPFSRGSLHCC